MSTQATIAVCLFVFAFAILGLVACLAAHQRATDRMYEEMIEIQRQSTEAFFRSFGGG